jgi:hypothetical protein
MHADRFGAECFVESRRDGGSNAVALWPKSNEVFGETGILGPASGVESNAAVGHPHRFRPPSSPTTQIRAQKRER